jgi:hypothetical protein
VSRREQPLECFIDPSLGRRHLADALRAYGLVIHTMASVYGDTEEELEAARRLNRTLVRERNSNAT